jgi:sortase A
MQHPHKRRKKQKLYTLFLSLIGLVVFIGVLLGFTIYSNWPAVQNELAYAFRHTETNATPTPSPSAQTKTIIPTPIVVNEPAHIIIDKIGVDVAVQWDIAAEDTIPALDHGVAHLKGSAELGQVGNLFITGHSSDYVWKHNPFAAVFSLLPKLVAGDTITIRQNGQAFVYKVTETKIVHPTQVEVTNATDTPILTLMTCYPIGTSKDRFIVQATLISSPQIIQPTVQNNGSISVPVINFR